MMRFEHDPALVEQATFLVAKRDPEHECLLHEALDPLYKIPDAELRQRAFREAYGDLFRRFGLDRLIPSLVREFPLVAERLTRCIIREAERSRAQSVDMYTQKSGDSDRGGERVLVLALCPESLLDRERLAPWMHRQLQHVEDMLDERFAYDTRLPAVSRVQQNLIRDRYAALWDVYVEGRLIRSGRLSDSAVPGLWSSFSQAFTCHGRSPSRITFERLLGAPGLTHAELLRWATDAATSLDEEDGGNDVRSKEASAGAVC